MSVWGALRWRLAAAASPRPRRAPLSCSPWPAPPSPPLTTGLGPPSLPTRLSFGVVLAAIAVVGAIVTLAVPGNRTGWLLLTAAAVMGVGLAFTEAGIHGVVTAPGSVPGAAYLVAIGPGLQAAGMLIAVVGVPVVFPDGHLPGPRWRWLAWSAAAAVTCLFLGNVLSPGTNEDRLSHWHSPLGLPGSLRIYRRHPQRRRDPARRGRRRRGHRRAGRPVAARRPAGPATAAAAGPGRLAACAGPPRRDHRQRRSRLDLRRRAPAAAGRDRGRDPQPWPV